MIQKRPQQQSAVIREATPQEVLRWDDLVTRFDNYRIVHKLSWLRSLEECVGGKPLYLIFETDGDIVGCLPGLLITKGFLRLFGSPLPGWQTVSMGPVFDKTRISTHEMIVSLTRLLEEDYGVHHIELMSTTLDHQTMAELGFRGEAVFTYRARLFPGDEEKTAKTLKSSTRQNVRRALRLGLVPKFENEEGFIDEIYDQIKESFVRRGCIVSFSKQRVSAFFRHMKAAGNLVAVSVYLPQSDVNIATGMFTIEGTELLLWQWAHRTEYRGYRPTELMTWTVLKKAVEAGCTSFDLMGSGGFKKKFGAQPDLSKYRWVRSRYRWITGVRDLAQKCYRWQQSLRGRIARLRLPKS